jgi:hypothetical protein
MRRERGEEREREGRAGPDTSWAGLLEGAILIDKLWGKSARRRQCLQKRRYRPSREDSDQDLPTDS